MSRSIIEYNDFRGGEFDQKGAWNVPKNFWTGKNVHVYTTGDLGVRAGVINQTPSGVANGEISGFGTTGVPGRDAWYVQGTALRRFSILGGNGLATVTGAFGGASAEVLDSCLDTSFVFIAGRDLTGTYVYDVLADTNTKLTGSPAAGSIERYGDRLVVGNIDGSFGFRLRFTDALNFNSWPAGNFIDIGDGWDITGVSSQRQHLLISKQTGFYVLTGVPGVNSVVRKVYSGPGPLWSHEQSMGMGDTLYHEVVNFPYPCEFNGSTAKRWYDNINGIGNTGQGNPVPAYRGVSALRGAETGFVIPSTTDSKLMEVRSGTPSYHEFDVDISGYTDKRGSESLVPLVFPGSVSEPPAFYLWNPYADSPGIEGGDFMRAGDDTADPIVGNVTFAEWYAPDGDEFYVRTVIVDFRTWDTGGSENNRFDLRVHALRRYNNGSPEMSQTFNFDQDPAESSVDGNIYRRVFGIGNQGAGNGFQLAFDEMRGVALQRVQVVIDRRPVRA